MHLLLRELHPLGPSAGQGRRPVDDLARLRRHHHGGGRPPGREPSSRRSGTKYKGQYILAVRRQSAAQRGRHVLHRRRPPVRRAAPRSLLPTRWPSSPGAPAPPGAASRRRKPNPTRATPVHKVITDKPIIKVPGCPPIAEVMTGVITYIADLRQACRSWTARAGRRCSTASASTTSATAARISTPASSSSSGTTSGARKGYCLYKMGCKGPTTYNACSTTRWNGGVSLPDPVRPRLHRLLRRRLLGQGLVLRPPDQHPRSSASRRTPTRSAARSPVVGRRRRPSAPSACRMRRTAVNSRRSSPQRHT